MRYRSIWLTTTVTIAIACALTACAGRGAPEATIPLEAMPFPSGSTIPTDAPTPVPTPAVTVGPADLIGTVSMPWRFVSSGAAPNTAVIAYVDGDGGCFVHRGFSLTPMGDAVQLTAVSSRPPDHAICATPFWTGVAIVTLPASVTSPDRLVHAPTDPEWQRTADLAHF